MASINSKVVTWYILILVAAAAQYALPAVHAATSGRAIYWGLDSQIDGSGGILQYFKDAFIVVFGAIWPFLIVRNDEFFLYVVWFLGVLLLGSAAYLVGNGFLPYFFAGMRWVAGLHAAAGFFFLFKQRGMSGRHYLIALYAFLVLATVSSVLSLLQARSTGLLHGRVPGLFSVAGTNGVFAASLAITASLAPWNRWRLKMLAYFLAVLLGVLSGTRFTIIAIALLALSELAHLRAFKGRGRFDLVMLFAFLIPASAVGAIGIAGALTGRGNLVADQQSQGGRLNSIPQVIEQLRARGELVDFLIGRGIGQGTNTAHSLSANLHILPSWQILIDNTYITIFIQFGWIGGAWVIIGAGLFFCFRGLDRLPVLLIIFLSTLTQNFFEQIFLLLSLALYFGVSNSRRKISSNLLKRSRSRDGPSYQVPVRI
jgi:hypothetical protein